MKFLLEGKSWPEHPQKDSIAGQNLLSQDAFVGPAVEVTEPKSEMRSTAVSVEQDPNGIDSKQPGSKLDAGKVDLLRGAINYFPNALTAVARVSELGAAKYSWKGWETVPDGINRYGAALARHLLHEPFATDDGVGGLGNDVLHAAQSAWNALARLELILKELDGKRSSNP